jgi:hypothetical protein
MRKKDGNSFIAGGCYGDSYECEEMISWFGKDGNKCGKGEKGRRN